MPTFGTLYNPGIVVDVPDESYSDEEGNTRTLRPPAATSMPVKDAATLVDLDPIILSAYGQWSYTTADASKILVSPDGGTTWVGPLYSAESDEAARTSGETAALALTQSTTVLSIAEEARLLAEAGGGGGGGNVEEIYETAAGVYPPPTSTIRRVFIGQVRPTLAQGRRDKDLWRNVVYA